MAALLGAPSAAWAAKTIEVHPGKNAIKKAIARANSGDRIRVHAGRYREAPIIGKRVRIVAAKGEHPVIDGHCRAGIVIAVRANGVLLRGLTVIGADEGFGSAPINVDFNGVRSGTARGLVVRNTCGDEVEYGINVFDSRKVEVVNNVARGFTDAGIYVGGISSTGNGVLRVMNNETMGNNRGVIVEDSAGGRIAVEGNRIQNNRRSGEGPPSGIFLHNSDGVLIDDNRVTGNGEIGIHLDPNSDRNMLFDNTVRQNPVDLLNEGSGNCGELNIFGDGSALPAC